MERVQYETLAPIAHLSNSAQLEGTLYHSPNLHPGPHSSVGMRRGTDRETHRRAWPIYISRRPRLTRNVTTTIATKAMIMMMMMMMMMTEVSQLNLN